MRVMNKFEEVQFLKMAINKFSRDETIIMLNKRIKAIETENGILRTQIAEMKDLSKPTDGKKLARCLRFQVVNLKQTLIQNNIQIPECCKSEL